MPADLTPRKTVLCFGEILWDLLPDGPVLGGAPFNLACRLTALGDHGVIVSRLGRDEYGHVAHGQVTMLEMETDHLQWDDQHPTGTVEVAIDARGNPDFTLVRDVAYDHIDVSFELLTLASKADCFCFGTLAQRSTASALTLNRLLEVCPAGRRFLDLNLRKDSYNTRIIGASLKEATIVKLNGDELRRVAFAYDLPGDWMPDLCQGLMDRFELQCIVVTLGELGAYAATADGKRVYVPGHRVEVVDTCGSGDAFSAGFLHAYLRDEGLKRACLLGNALGALVATQTGATAPVSSAEVQALLESPLPRNEDPGLKVFSVG